MSKTTYPANHAAALLEQLETERAITEVTELALEVWLDIAKADVLRAAAEPPPDPSQAADHNAQWNYLVDGMIIYAIAVIAANAMDTAYTVLSGAPLAAAGAISRLATFDMPGMPTQISMRESVGRVLSRRLDITVSTVESRLESVPDIRRFAEKVSQQVRGRVLDAVGRVFKRSTDTINAAPATATVPELRADLAPVFDPLDPQWKAAADMVGQTHATGALNAALEEAARTTGREMALEWVAILDTHTRIAHAEANGQTREPGQAFEVDAEPLRFPADPLGSPDNTINCRCRLFVHFTTPHPDLVAAVAFVTEAVETYGLEFNWVDACGGLPKYIQRISKHLIEGGMDKSHAIATAVNAVHKMCETGDVNFPGRQSVNKMSRAEACTASAEWTKLRECAARKQAAKASAQPECAECTETDTITAGGSAVDYRSFTSTLAVIGTPTDDGRIFASDIALSFRDFPLPLLWQKQSAGGHTDAFTVGVIESAGVVGTEVIGKGYLLNTPEAQEAALQIEHGVTGPSVDLGDVSWEMRTASGAAVTEQDFYDNPDLEVFQTVVSAKVLAATLVATPAFGQTTITLGDTVAKGEDALVAAAAMTAPGVIDLPVYPAEFFTDPQFSGPTLPHMTADGRLQGHLAAWNVCHVGIQDTCVLAPHSETDYAWFHTAPPVKTTAGPAKVGRLTVGTGHAGPKLAPVPTIAHYDNTGTAFALVHVGEDDYGIWFSGVAAPTADAEKIAEGLSAPLSGDWRSVGGNLELVAALSVNTPGFPIIASGATDDTDAPVSLIASLGPCGDTADGPQMSEDQLIVFARTVVAEMRAADKRSAEAAELINSEVGRQALALIQEV